MKRIITSILVSLSLIASAQYFPVSPNKVDENGRRNGFWTILYDSTFARETKNQDSAFYYRLIKYEAGKPLGKVRDFYRNGQKQWEGFMLSINPPVFDGPCIYYYQNGETQYKIDYKNGKADGFYQEFSSNGKLIGEGKMKDDKAIGKWNYYNEDGLKVQETEILSDQSQAAVTFHPNGSIKNKGIYIKNQKEGLWENYYEDGTINSRCEYKNGERNGKWEWYNTSGIVEETGSYLKGKKFGSWVTYQDGANALMKTGSYDSSERETGHWIYYYTSGAKKSEGEMFEGGNLGEWKFYHESGGLKSIGLLKGGKFFGTVKYYYPSGELEQVAEYLRDTANGHTIDYYKDGKIKAEGRQAMGKKDGLWKFYSTEGVLETEERLVLGVLEGRAKNYYPDGKIKEDKYYKHGSQDSVSTAYFLNGNTESRGFYKAGKREGVWNWYYNNGQLDSRYFYKDGLYEGPYECYYENGVLWKTGSGLHGQPHGMTIRRYRNGKVKEEGLDQFGKSTGRWKAYDSATGKVTSIWGYKNGRYHGKNIYYTKTRERKIDYYINGFKETPYNIRDSVYVLVKKLKLFDQAWKMADWAESVAKRDYKKNDPANAVALYIRGYVLQYARGESANALPYVLKYIALEEKLEGKNADNYINALNDLANLYSDLKRNEEALVIYDTLIEKKRKGNKSVLTYLYNKALSLKELGRAAEVKNLFQEEIHLQKKKGKTHPDALAARQKWAEYVYDWNFSEATASIYEELLNDALKADPQSDLVLLCHRQISFCYNSIANRAKTIHWLKKTLELTEKKNIPSFFDYCHDLDLLANHYLNIRYLDSAGMTYDKMSAAIEKRNMSGTYLEADMLDGKAELRLVNSDYNNALNLELKAKTILEQQGFEKTVRYAEVLEGVALDYNGLNRTKEGIPIYEQAISIRKQNDGEYNKHVIHNEIILAGLYSDIDENDKAKSKLQEVIKKIGDTPGAVNRENYSFAQRKLAQLKRDDEDFKGAIECNEKGIVFYEANKSNDVNAFAETCTDLAYDYRNLGEPVMAEKYLNRALESVEEILGKENRTYLRVYWSLANHYASKELYTEASRVYNEVLKGYEKLYGQSHVIYSNVLFDLGSCYLDASEYAKAEKAFEKYLQLKLALGANHTYDYLKGIKKLAGAKYLQEKYVEAEKCYLSAIPLAAEIYGPQHPSYALNLKLVAEFYFKIGRNADAETRIVTATQIMRDSKDYGPKSIAYSRYIVLQGQIFLARDKNKEAEEYLTEAVAVTSSFKTTHHYEHIKALEALAEFYQKMGQYRGEEKLLKEVLDLTEAKSGKGFDYAEKKVQLMTHYYASANYNECLATGRELLPYLESELSMSHNLVREVHNIMGLSEVFLENFKAGADHFKYCIEILDLAKETHTPLYAIYLNNLSLTTMALGDFATTEKLLMQAADIRKENNVVLPPFSYALITDNYASLYQAWGKLDKAEKYWLDVISALLNHTRQNFYFLSDEGRAQFWNQIKGDFEYFNTFAVARSKQNPAILGEMYNNQLATKAILLSTSNKIRKRIFASRDKEMINHYYNWVDVREHLAQLYTSSDAELKNKKTEVDSLEVVAKGIEKELNISSEDLAHDKGGQNKMTTWKEVQRTLATNEAAVEIIRFRYYDRYLRDSVIYAALVLTSETKQSPKMVILPSGKLLEARAIRYYKNAIASRVEDKFSYNYFWRPLEAVLQGKTRIYLSLDGVYNQINLNTLADANGKFLVESKNLTIVSNTKDLLLLRGKRNAKESAASASLFGYPRFFIGKKRLQEKIQNQKRDLDLASLADNDATGIAELPGTQTEIEQVKNVLLSHHWQTTDFTDEQATEKALKSIDYPKILHIATHGFFVDENEASATFKVGAATEYAKNNPLLRSGLLLSGASNFIQNNVRLDDENGILTAYEAANLNLDNTDLVVLSACETGKGEVQNGEGVYGLQRAFQTAGAQAIVMSLWKVDDEATQELMTSFYQNWMNGTPKAEAFRQAQLQLKNKYSHPYYWGAFVMMGN